MAEAGLNLEDVINQFEKSLLTKRSLAIISFRKLQNLGILPPQIEFSAFESQFRLKFDEMQRPISFEFDDELLGIKVEKSILPLEITSEDVEALTNDDLLAENLIATEDEIEHFIQASGAALAEDWKTQASELLQIDRDRFSDFRIGLNEVWGEVLELLEILLSTSLDKGASFNETHSKLISQDDALVFHVANFLFGRACQVGREIHILLSSGLADGAEARWRTLHEIMVTVIFIIQNGHEVAERFVDHERINTFDTVKGYWDYWKPEGVKVIAEKDYDQLKKERDNLIQKYDKEFSKNYGWATKALGKRATFADIEKASGHDYLRPVYKEANSNIHASSRGTVVRLGLPHTSNAILASYSIFGIGEIAWNTAFSMVVLIENLLMIYPSTENRIYVQATEKLADQIHKAYLTAEKVLRQRQAKNEDER